MSRIQKTDAFLQKHPNRSYFLNLPPWCAFSGNRINSFPKLFCKLFLGQFRGGFSHLV